MAVTQGKEDLMSGLGSVERPAGIEDPENVSEWTNLLSELLLALLGCSGGAFVASENPEDVAKYVPDIKLSDDVDWISEGERWVVYIVLYLVKI